MKKIILSMALALGLATPALATVDNPKLPPENVNITIVSVGTLYNNDTVKMTGNNGKTITVHLSQCEVDWTSNDPFYLIVAPNTAIATPVSDFQTVYQAVGKDWNTTIAYLTKYHKLCIVQPD